MFENKTTYKNNSKTLECVTILMGESLLEGLSVKTGTTIILEPEEETNFNNRVTFITARPITGENNE